MTTAKKPSRKGAASKAVPKRKPAPDGIPQELWDSWALPTFEPGPNGEVTAEEQAAVDEQGAKIVAFRKTQRDEADKAERENHAGKLERAEKRRVENEDFKVQFAALVKIVADHEQRMLAKGV